MRYELQQNEEARVRAFCRQRDREDRRRQARQHKALAAQAEKLGANAKPAVTANDTSVTPPADGPHLRAWDYEHVRQLETSAANRFSDRDELARAKNSQPDREYRRKWLEASAKIRPNKKARDLFGGDV